MLCIMLLAERTGGFGLQDIRVYERTAASQRRRKRMMRDCITWLGRFCSFIAIEMNVERASNRQIMARALGSRAPALVVDLGGGDVTVSEQGLHLADVHAGV